MGKFSRLGNDLYTGERSIDFVSKRLVWYLVSVILVLGSAGIVVGKGLNLGIEFTGGTQFNVAFASDEVNQDTADRLRESVAERRHRRRRRPDRHHLGQRVDPRADREARQQRADALIAAIADRFDVDPADISLDRDRREPRRPDRAARLPSAS